VELGFEILSPGDSLVPPGDGTPGDAGVRCDRLSRKILDGRVKTLHPKIHGGILPVGCRNT
jgi:AICAR transformylase/IMP cyclohydrolase PurH